MAGTVPCWIGATTFFEEQWPAGGAIKPIGTGGEARAGRGRSHDRLHLRHDRQANGACRAGEHEQRLLLVNNATLANYERALIVPGLSLH